MNPQSFEYCEQTSLKLQPCFLKSLFEWIFFFFFISKNSLKSAEGRNPSTQEVYKSAPNRGKERTRK